MTPEERIDELLEKLIVSANGNIWYDYIEKLKIPEIAEAKASLLQMLDSARLDEMELFKPVAESWVAKHYSYLGVNYLNERVAKLSASANAGRPTPNPKEKES